MKLGYALTAWALYLSPAMLWAVPMLPATASFSGCPSSMASSAAILEILECGGSVSTKESSCLTNDDGTSTEEAGFQLKGYTFSEPFHLIVSYGPSTSAASPTFNPVSQRSVAPETRADPPEPVPPLATPTSEPPVFSSPDPHLHHRMGILLKHTQDIRDLLGYLLVELRDLSGRLKPKTTEPPAK
ncbi:Fc receptor-like A isoform X3 [Fukomys damarensis]|uniref:Fc receptor-like A isoform X3 n=1 Tax=Fukomys damarensis TaxID=885580 RepID=UPI0014556068|nr:Fc receptor-like A isoform X3 [Fukomys damarensis]